MKAQIPVELLPSGTTVPMRTVTEEISLCGCYVPSMFTLEVGKTLDVIFSLDEGRIRASAVVATRFPNIGNGIDFIDMDPNDRITVHYPHPRKLLAVVAPNGRPTSTRVMGGHPVFAKAAVDAVEKWKWTPAPEETREVLEMHFRPEMSLGLLLERLFLSDIILAACLYHSPENQAKHMGSQASQSRELRWRRLYEAAVLEMDQEILPRRVTVAKKAIHSQIVRSHKMDEAGELWALMDAINVLNDLLKMNEADLRQRAKKGHTRKGWRALVDIPMPLRTRLAV